MRPLRIGAVPRNTASMTRVRTTLARWAWPLLLLALVTMLATILPGHSRHPATNGSRGSGPTLHTLQLERQHFGRAQRPYIRGRTGVHVAAVSSGDPYPYPNVNNTERWQALKGSIPGQFDFTILGQGEAWEGDKGVTKNKLMYYLKWLRTVPPEDVVIIVDAHDVLFFPCQRDVVQEYRKTGVDILFTADYNAFPDNETAAYYPDSPKAQSHGPIQKFLNCGGFIGHAEDIQYFLTKYFIGSGRHHDAFKDQRFWTDMFLAQVHKTGAYKGEEPTLGLDYEGRVFQMFRAAPVSDEGCWTMDLKAKAVTAAQKCPDLYDAEACILHGPGYSKKVFWFDLVPKWRAANDTQLY